MDWADGSDMSIMPNGGTLRHHPEGACSGDHCVIHNPSDHHMAGWPPYWRADRRIVERICPHGVGHPDPDSLAHRARIGDPDDGTHGCEGCCVPPDTTLDATSR